MPTGKAASRNDRTDTLFVPGRNCWQVARADHAAVIIDAADYFRFARAGMLAAKRQILLIGWDFDARIEVEAEAGDDGPARIGDLLSWLVDRTPELEIYLLRWDMGALKTLVHGRTLVSLLGWIRREHMHARLDNHHPTGASHHQKLIVIDDCLAFCGGIDMTANRWDTREHKDDDPRRTQPNGKPALPWHDAAWAVDGALARALGDLGRARWKRSGAAPPAPVKLDRSCWPKGLPVDFTAVDMAIARSVPLMEDEQPVREIEELYRDQIMAARQHLYIESQYFASRRIAEWVGARLEGENPPEIVIINPVAAEGWLQPLAMDSARAELFRALKLRDRQDRLRIYHPFTAGGTPIYVHAKILIADDRILRVGSSNVNNRSLRLDTECDLSIDAHGEGAETAQIRRIRDGLIAEHLGLDIGQVSQAIDESGSLIATIEALRGKGKTLRPYAVPDLSEAETWLADNELLDPEGPEEMFEPLSRRGLFRKLRWPRRKVPG
ncbi:phospholipase D-like domain-containing protein [Sphingomonas oligophenolica]|uniref:Phospholipase D n=1 Tax=Sphingomonas oligophenolica TaxID=301154 RepID=A0ABU9Y0Y2_9SPHN